MTDYYPDEEGVLVDGLSIGWAQCSTAISAMGPVALDTATSGNIVVKAGTISLDCQGVAMRAGASSDYIPILLYGVAKFLLGGTCVVGSPVGAGTTAGYVLRIPTYTDAQNLLLHGLNYTGTIEILGKALQGGTTGDEILVLVAPL
jgi:hypothetical protein